MNKKAEKECPKCGTFYDTEESICPTCEEAYLEEYHRKLLQQEDYRQYYQDD